MRSPTGSAIGTRTTHGNSATGSYAEAPDCDFVSHDFGNLGTNPQDCGPTCLITNGCTHYGYLAPGCYMKIGNVTEADAIAAPNQKKICGLILTFAPHPPSPPAPPVHYTLVKNYDPASFLTGNDWTFFTQGDPTGGFVKFLDRNAAMSAKILAEGTNGGQSYALLGSAATNGPVQSIRVTSVKSFNGALVIFDALHIPTGCGTWPAFWTVGPHWPWEGEIDIMEGVNGVGNNSMTLHTRPGCNVPDFQNSSNTKNCNANNAYNGCGYEATAGGTFGASFNNNPGGGGVYAMEWIPGDKGGIQVWSFPRAAIPADITSGKPVPASWPTKTGYAKFPFGPECWGSTFQDHQIVIDLTFCGQWAGIPAIFNADCGKVAGGKKCSDYLNNNHEALTEAYFKIYSVKLYQSPALKMNHKN